MITLKNTQQNIMKSSGLMDMTLIYFEPVYTTAKGWEEEEDRVWLEQQGANTRLIIHMEMEKKNDMWYKH